MFLIAAGYKTYRFLPLFFREFYPRYDLPTPPAIKAIIDALAMHKYPDDYDSATSVIHAQAHHYRLREGVADITPERLRDPHVKFFAHSNPDHIVGSELCCLARLARANFTRAAEHIYPVNRATSQPSKSKPSDRVV